MPTGADDTTALVIFNAPLGVKTEKMEPQGPSDSEGAAKYRHRDPGPFTVRAGSCELIDAGDRRILAILMIRLPPEKYSTTHLFYLLLMYTMCYQDKKIRIQRTRFKYRHLSPKPALLEKSPRDVGRVHTGTGF